MAFLKKSQAEQQAEASPVGTWAWTKAGHRAIPAIVQKSDDSSWYTDDHEERFFAREVENFSADKPIIRRATSRIYNGSDSWPEALTDNRYARFSVVLLNGNWYAEDQSDTNDWAGEIIPAHNVDFE